MEVQPLQPLQSGLGVSNPDLPPITQGGWAEFDHHNQFRTGGGNDGRIGGVGGGGGGGGEAGESGGGGGGSSGGGG